ncbi:hypothetical protein C8R44DRAFT_808636 [Mycena epipterygia]|nr:hypothetical protein C8R44DRAFT_808636 [Mycena epipterygia]
MHFLLSSNKPMNATYREAESSVAQYKVKTPIKLPDLTTTISRLIDSDIPRRDSQGDSSAAPDSGRFGHLAQISWRVRGPTFIRFGDRDIDPATFFRKENKGWHGRYKERVFTAQDGREYRWCKTAYTSRLKVNDASATLVAEYRAHSLGLLSKAGNASLQIFPPFEHMIDEIMVTFIYIEKLRSTHIDGSSQL